MKKKLLIFMLVLGMVSSANALVVDMRADGNDTLEVTLTPEDDTVRISINSDTGVGGNYSRVVTVDDYGTTSGLGSFTAMTITSNAGPDSYVTNPYYGYTWAYLAYNYDSNPGEDPPIYAGEQFYFDYTATSFAGDKSIQQIVDLRNRDLTWSLIESMVITQVPEPMTIALLGLGGLFLRRRK